jgi:hypothetical protein
MKHMGEEPITLSTLADLHRKVLARDMKRNTGR